MRHNSSTVLEAFVNGEKAGDTQNLHINGAVLRSYATEVAMHIDGGRIALNPEKYSPTTSRQMTHLKCALIDAGFVETDERYSSDTKGVWFSYRSWPLTGWVVWQRS